MKKKIAVRLAKIGCLQKVTDAGLVLIKTKMKFQLFSKKESRVVLVQDLSKFLAQWNLIAVSIVF